MIFLSGLLYAGLVYLVQASTIIAIEQLSIYLIFSNLLVFIIKSYTFDKNQNFFSTKNTLCLLVTLVGCIITLNSITDYSWFLLNAEGLVLGIILIVSGSILRK